MLVSLVKPPPVAKVHGFTLIELSITLIIVTLLSGGLMMSLAARQDASATAETRHHLNDAREALLGFAAANGRLPCPAAPGTTGTESPPGGGACTHPWDGYLPAITLDIPPTDARGYAIDGWGNPIRYGITTYTNSSHCPGQLFATANCLAAAWSGPPPEPDLHVCTTAIGMLERGASAKCAAGSMLAGDAVAVIYSQGKNGAALPISPDEQANGNADRLFVSHPMSQAGSSNDFDDIVTWLSPNILYSRLIAAGRLP